VFLKETYRQACCNCRDTHMSNTHGFLLVGICLTTVSVTLLPTPEDLKTRVMGPAQNPTVFSTTIMTLLDLLVAVFFNFIYLS